VLLEGRGGAGRLVVKDGPREQEALGKEKYADSVEVEKGQQQSDEKTVCVAELAGSDEIAALDLFVTGSACRELLLLCGFGSSELSGDALEFGGFLRRGGVCFWHGGEVCGSRGSTRAHGRMRKRPINNT